MIEIQDQFPYPVHVAHDLSVELLDLNDPVRIVRYDWLCTHIGKRDEMWCYPVCTQFRFKTQADAILFSLTWS